MEVHDTRGDRESRERSQQEAADHRELMTAGRSGVEADNDNVGYAEYHTACAEEEAIRTGAFLPTDSQKELALAIHLFRVHKRHVR